MLKKFFSFLFKLLFALAIIFTLFFFWASSATLPEEAYRSMHTYGDCETVAKDSVITIATYNIGYLSGMTNNTTQERKPSFFDANLKKVQQHFSALDIDILALQEIDYASKRSFEVDQQQALASLGFCNAAQAINWDKRYVPFPQESISAHFSKVVSGQSVLSKFPVTAHDRIELDRVEAISFMTDAFYLDRLAQVVSIAVDNRSVKVINLHAEAFDAATREKHLKACADLYKKYASDHPTILLGDFNSNLAVEDLLEKHILSLPHVKMAVEDLSEGTFPADKPTKKIDFIFYNENHIEKVAAKTITAIGAPSDHLPVLMRFRLK